MTMKLKREDIIKIMVESEEPEAITSHMMVEDMEWLYTDEKGHEHRWTEHNDDYSVTGCTKCVKRTEFIEPCECCGQDVVDYNYNTIYTCDKCGEAIQPQYRDELVRVEMPKERWKSGMIEAKGLWGLQDVEDLDLADISEHTGRAYVDSIQSIKTNGKTTSTLYFQTLRA